MRNERREGKGEERREERGGKKKGKGERAKTKNGYRKVKCDTKNGM